MRKHDLTNKNTKTRQIHLEKSILNSCDVLKQMLSQTLCRFPSQRLRQCLGTEFEIGFRRICLFVMVSASLLWDRDREMKVKQKKWKSRSRSGSEMKKLRDRDREVKFIENFREFKQDQIVLERSARWSYSVFCVLCTDYCGRGCVSFESERGKELS